MSTYEKLLSACFLLIVLFGGSLTSAEHSSCLRAGLYEHPTDCNKFYICTPAGPVLMHCPTNLHFNPLFMVCDWPHNAGCDAKYNENPGIQDDLKSCPIFQHPIDCAKFYMCSPSGLALMECPAGLHFNPQISVCDWPYNVDCDSNGTSTTTEFLNGTNSEITTNEETTQKDDNTSYFEATTESMIPENFSIHVENESTSFSDFISPNGEESTAPTIENGEATNQSTVEQQFTTNTLEASTEISTLQDMMTSQDLGDTFQSTTEELALSATHTTQLCIGNIWPHQEDCTKFYMCGSTGAEEKLCPKPLHFNPTLLVCDWPYQAGCDDSKLTTLEEKETTTEYAASYHTNVDSTVKQNTFSFEATTEEDNATSENILIICESSIWPHPEDCTKFYMCGSTGAEEKLCPNPLHFNPTLLVCDWPYQAGCDDSKLTTREEKETTTKYSSSYHTSESIEQNTISFETTTEEDTATSENIPIICESSIWPHPGDCTKFYMCGSTGAEEKLCPKPLHFNPTLLVCDWPYQAGCDDSKLTTLEEKETTTEYAASYHTNVDSTVEQNTFSFEATTEEDNATSENIPIICESSIWPHPEDCTKFYMCGSTGAEEKLCPKPLHFNPTLLVCDWPYQAGCDDSKLTTLEEKETTTEYSSSYHTSELIEQNTISFQTTTEEDTATSENIPIICESSIWPHPEDCTKFYMCGSTGAEEKLCPKPLHFNPTLLVCDWPYQAGCDDSEITTLEGKETTTASYHTYVDSTVEQNTFSFEATTEEYTSGNIPVTCESGIWPHPEDCTKFYICGSAGVEEKVCPTPLQFNTELLVCDLSHRAGCENSSSTVPDDVTAEMTTFSSTTKNPAIIPDSYEVAYPQDIDNQSPHQSETTFIPTDFLEHTEASIIARTKSSGNNLCVSSIWPHPQDCAKFLVCGDKGPMEKDCPQNLHFNPVLLVCDWPYRVNCRL